jgi:hypothetical protein
VKLLEGARGAAQERLDVLGDPFGVAAGGQAERLGVHLRDLLGDSCADHRVLVLLEGELPVEDSKKPSASLSKTAPLTAR